jgi:hypothetical protein
MLFNERMIESFVIARLMFLKNNGKLFPSTATLCCCPFSDEKLYNEKKYSAESFWNTENFFGIKMKSITKSALTEKFTQPIIGVFDQNNRMANSDESLFDFRNLDVENLLDITHTYRFTIERDGIMHGAAFWFISTFKGSDCTETLNTGAKITAYYQCKLLLAQPLGILKGQHVKVILRLKANDQMSYDAYMKVKLKEISV